MSNLFAGIFVAVGMLFLLGSAFYAGADFGNFVAAQRCEEVGYFTYEYAVYDCKPSAGKGLIGGIMTFVVTIDDILKIVSAVLIVVFLIFAYIAGWFTRCKPARSFPVGDHKFCRDYNEDLGAKQ